MIDLAEFTIRHPFISGFLTIAFILAVCWVHELRALGRAYDRGEE